MLSECISARALCALLTFIALAVPASSATAGTYMVDTCGFGQGSGDAGWTNAVFPSAASGDFVDSGGCGSSGIAAAFAPATVADGAQDVWTFTAPPHTTIGSANLYQWAETHTDGATVRLVAGYADGTSQVIDAATAPGDRFGHVQLNDLSSLRVEVGCAFPGGCAGSDAGGLAGASYSLGDGQIQLIDNDGPGGGVTGGGWQGTPGDGTLNINYHSSDAGSGIQSIELLLNGNTVMTDWLSCTRNQPVPCPLSHDGTFAFDTTNVPNGTYQLGLAVTDYAGNRATSAPPGQLVIDHPQPASSQTSSATAVAPLATSPNPISAPPLADAAPPPARVLLTAIAGNGRRVQQLRFGKPTVITGRLTDAAGMPIAGAILSVAQRTALPGAALAEAANVVTGPDGRFTYLAPAESSRLIQIGYRAFTGDSAFAATADVNLLVSAGVTLKASKTKLHNRQATVFTGKLLAKPNGTRGVVVDLQVLFRGHWRTIADPRTNAKGAFTFRYRFMAGAARWKFRARVRADAAYPYTLGYSAKPVWVHVL